MWNRHRRHSYLPALFFALCGMAAANASEIRLFVAVPSFIVSVAPVDKESRDADNSILYQRFGDDGDWVELGECARQALADGDVRFTREVTVDRDGLYQYTSRPLVGGKVNRPPEKDSPAQAWVVVDTLTPTVEILAPREGAAASPKENLTLSWTSADENFSEKPVSLSFSSDGGKSWNSIESDLPAAGELDWIVPEDALPLAIRLTATDRAGNIGRALRSVDLAVPEPITPPDLPPLEQRPPVQPAETIQDAEKTPQTGEEEDSGRNRSWLYYLMALNYMRQNLPADALQYYWLSVKEDPDFIDAWADMGLAYNALKAYKSAREVIEQARSKAPNRIDLMQMMGEIDQSEGMDLLARARTPEERLQAKGLIDKAVEWYGRALDKAAADWRLSEQAASFYRLGEICYYVNMDRDGARAYWRKILDLHSPTPNRDLMDWAPEKDKKKAKQRYERYTHQRVSLNTWQKWARGYLEQLDERERRGILDLMPAQRITAIPAPQPLPYGSNPINPGREDGRSLFSLPSQLGGEAAIPAVEGFSSSGPATTARQPSPRQAPAKVTDNYSFYGEARSPAPRANAETGRRIGRNGDSLFTGGPDQPQINPDPYAFPQRGPTAPWNHSLPYGDRPVDDW